MGDRTARKAGNWAGLARRTALALGAMLALSLSGAGLASASVTAAPEANVVEAPVSVERLHKQQVTKGPRRGQGQGQGQGGGSIVGQWSGIYSWSTGAGGPLDLDIMSGGTLQAGDFLPWSWTQNGNAITFTEQSGNTWTGVLRGDTISGTMRRFDGTATGTFEFSRAGGGGQAAILGDWSITIQFPSTGPASFTHSFLADGTWLEDNEQAGQWRREGNEFVWTWGEFGSGRMNFRAAINGNRAYGQTDAGYAFEMVRGGGAPAADLGGDPPVGTWRGQIVWHGANTIDLNWVFSSDGSIVTEFGESGTWQRNGARGFRGTYRGGGGDTITFEGAVQGNRISGAIASDHQGGFTGTFDMRRSR